MNILIAASPLTGHVNPLISLTRLLTGSGNKVKAVCASTFREGFIDAGAEFYPFPCSIDRDFNDLYSAFPEREGYPVGPERLCYDFKRVFLDQIEEQYITLINALEHFQADVIICDSFYMGTLPVLLSGNADFPPVIHHGITILPLPREDGAPFGPGLPPASNEEERKRYSQIGESVSELFSLPLQEYLNRILRKMNCPVLDIPLLDAMVTLPALYLQPSVSSFEYNLFDLPSSVRFTGLLPLSTSEELPEGLKERLRQADKVVLVTQGTLANLDFEQLIVPAIRALSGHENTLVIVTTGHRPPDELPHPLPENVYAAPFVCYARLMPEVSLVITNGGYGTVSQALVHGVPLVVAGMTEEKAEIGARVAWSGVGINLATSNPTAPAIEEAAITVLGSPSYTRQSKKIASEFAAINTPDVITGLIEELMTRKFKDISPVVLNINM